MPSALATSFVVASLLLAWGAWRLDSRRALIFTPFLLFMVWEVRLNWAPALWAPKLGLSSDYYVLSAVLAGFWTFVLAYLLVSRTVRVRTSQPQRFRDLAWKQESTRGYVYGLGMAVAVLIAAGLYLFQGVPPIGVAIASLIGGGEADAVALYLGASRQYITKSHYFGGEYRGQGLLRTLMLVGWSFIVLLSLSIYYATRRGRWLWITGIIAVPAVLFIGGDGTRAGIVSRVVLLLVFLSIITRLRPRAVVAGLMAVFALAILLSVVGPKLSGDISDARFVVEAVLAIHDRIFFGNGNNTVAMIELVRGGFWEQRWGGVHVRNIVSSIPGIQAGPPLAHELFLYQNPGSRSTTYLSPTYAAILYVDFGMPGILIGYAFMGAFVAIVQGWLLAARKTVFSVPLISLLIMQIGTMPQGGWTGLFAVSFVIVAFAGFVWLSVQLLGGETNRPLRGRRRASAVVS